MMVHANKRWFGKEKFVKQFRRMVLWWSGVVALLLWTSSVSALEQMPVQRLDLQANLLRAVIKFSTQQLDALVVGIIYVRDAEHIARDFAEELEKLDYNNHPVRVILVPAEALDSLDEAINVVYVTPGNALFLHAIADLCSERKIFTSTGIPAYVEQKKIALGFGEHEGKSQIILCLPAAQSTGHDFKNPRFLNLQATGKLILIK